METKKIFYVLSFFILFFVSCKKSTDIEVITLSYSITELQGMTVEEFSSKYYETPVVKEIKLIDHEFCSKNFKGQVLINEKEWHDISTPKNPVYKSFNVYIKNQIEGIEVIWFYIYNISEQKIEGDYWCIPYDQSIDPAPIAFIAFRKN